MIRCLDIVQDIARSAGLRVPTTIESASLDRWYQQILQDLNYVGLMLGRFTTWRWLEKEWTIRTVDDFSTGDADVTADSTAVTSNHASSAWTADMVGRAFWTSAWEEPYRIVDVASTTALTLDQPWNGATATDQTFTIAQDRYLLPQDFDIELGMLQFVTPKNIDLLPSLEFDRRRLGRLDVGSPADATIRGTEDGRLVLVLSPYPDDAIQIVVSYFSELNELKADNDTWGFPLTMKPVLRDGTVARFREHAQDDSRGQFDLQMFFQERAELAGLRRPTDNHPSFVPPTGYQRLIRKGKLGLNELGERFLESSGF